MALGDIKNGVTKMFGDGELSPIYYHFSASLVVVYPDRELIEVCPRVNDVAPQKIFFESLSAEDKEGATTAEELADIWANRGFFFVPDSPDIKYINNINQLPDPNESGVVDLGDNGIKYVFTRVVDLGGLSIDFGNNVINGISQELGGIQNAVVVIDQTCTVKSFRFNACDVTINAVDGAFDWGFVNFYDCTNVEIVLASNVVWETTGFINTYNVQLTGTVDSWIIAPNCIWRSVATDNVDFLAIRSTATVNRRIRIEDSVFASSFANQRPINIEAGATINAESFLLEDIAFIGPGSITGINGDDDRAFFTRCSGDGVINSTAIANMTIKDNQTATSTPVSGDRYKVAGITEVNNIIQRLVHDAPNNTLEYTSSVSRIFKILMPYTVFAGNNNVVGVYIAVTRAGNIEDPNTDALIDSEMYTTTNGSRPIGGTSQAIVTLNQGDKVYPVVENENGNTVRVEFLNMIIETANV